MSSLHWRAAAPLAVVAGLAAPFAALAAPLAAQEPRLQTLPVDPLVEVEWLLRHIADDDVVVVEAERRPGEFAEEHIAGARPLRFQDITWDGEEGWIVEFPEVDEIVAVLRAAGIQRDSRVVIYGTSMTATARTWATFDFLGLGDRAFLLDGGIADWKAAGGAVESGEAPPVEPGDVVARSPVDFRVSADWVARAARRPLGRAARRPSRRRVHRRRRRPRRRGQPRPHSRRGPALLGGADGPREQRPASCRATGSRAFWNGTARARARPTSSTA